MSDSPDDTAFVSPDQQTGLVSTLRWIAFLPAAYAAGVLAYLAFRMSFVVIGARSIPVIDELVAMGLSGLAFIVAGARVAPAGRKIVAVILFVVYAVMTGMVLFVGLQTQEDFEGAVGIAGLAAGVLGAGIGFFVAAGMEEKSQATK